MIIVTPYLVRPVSTARSRCRPTAIARPTTPRDGAWARLSRAPGQLATAVRARRSRPPFRRGCRRARVQAVTAALRKEATMRSLLSSSRWALPWRPAHAPDMPAVRAVGGPRPGRHPADYVFDAAAPGGSLAPGEARGSTIGSASSASVMATRSMSMALTPPRPRPKLPGRRRITACWSAPARRSRPAKSCPAPSA